MYRAPCDTHTGAVTHKCTGPCLVIQREMGQVMDTAAAYRQVFAHISHTWPFPLQAAQVQMESMSKVLKLNKLQD